MQHLFRPLTIKSIELKNHIAVSRFLLQVIAAIKQVWPNELPLFLRISASDWHDGGWTIEDSVNLANIVKTKGIDLIDCSSGGIIPNASIKAAPGYQIPFAETIKKETGILTGAVGFITDAIQANDIIASKQADLVFLAREFLRTPYFPLQAAEILGDNIAWPVQYERAKPRK